MLPAVAIAVLVGGVLGYVVALARMESRASAQDDLRRRGAVTPSAEADRAVRTAAPVGGVVVAGEESDSSIDDIGLVLRLAVNEIDLGVVVGTPDGRIIYRNRVASAMSGTHAGVIVEDQVDRALAAARRGEAVDEIVELHGPPGQSLQLFATSMPSGLAVATIDDVSARVRLDAMRTDFVANISHELKTPVGAIAVLSEALAGESDPAVVDRVALRLVEEAHRAVRAIDDLLELARIESTTRGGEVGDVVDVAGVVQEAVTRARSVESPAGVTVDAFDCDPDIRLRGDRRQLVSAVGNLVENAVKYSEPGGTVQVRTRADDRLVEIMVADQGIGIPARDLDRVFERFYRVDRARSRRTGGTGLGLSIVRHVASNHGGEVVVSSVEGEGSTFVLRLPAAAAVADRAAPDDRDRDRTGAGARRGEDPRT